jgi:P27 family predicted phage terminase small subunit
MGATVDRVANAPHDFTEPMRVIWRKTIRQLHEQGTWQDSDVGCLERYVRAVFRAQAARTIVASEGMTAEGSNGQPVAHPALRIAREAERDAAEYARDLLLTPAARRRAGVAETASLGDDLAQLVS